MSMMQMLMASHISEGLGDVPPLPIEVTAGLTEKVAQGLAVRSAVKEVLTIMDGSQPGCIFQTEQLSYSLERPITAIRAWLVDNAGHGSGEPVITGLAFRYRGSDRFIPDAPDAQDDANRRGRDPQTFREQTETLAAGESIVAVKCSSTATQFTSEITFPINEVTIAGNMNDILIKMIPANDLKISENLNSPTLLVENMTLAGI